MKRHQRLSLLVVVILSLFCSGWMYLATGPLGLGMSEVTLRFLGNVFDLIQPTDGSLEEDNLAVENMPWPSDKATHADHATIEPFPSQVLTSPFSVGLDARQPFSEVYVVSLPSRTDRRVGMDRVRQVVGLNWTYFAATPADNPVISRIAEQVSETRNAQTYAVEFSWPSSFQPESQLLHPRIVGPGLAPADIPHLLPESETPDVHPSVERPPLTCAVGNSTSGLPYDTSLPPYLLLTRSKLACWYSHVEVLQRIAQNRGNKSAVEEGRDAFLVLEDDVDMERDFIAKVREIWETLPADWDMVFLGHCWSNESFYPALNEPSSSTADNQHVALHPSYAPKCTHAYAVTRLGAEKLLSNLNYPPFAFSRALDQAYSWLIYTQRIKSYSLVPSVVVQRKVVASDVDAGTSGFGSKWKEQLANGVF